MTDVALGLRCKACALFAVVLAGGVPVVGMAAGADSNDKGDTGAVGTLEEVVVTAGKRGEASVQDVASNVSAVGEDYLKEVGATDAYAFARKANIQMSDQGNNSNAFVIRGIQGVGTSIVGVYFDEILSSGYGLNGNGGGQPNLRLFDINRVEILRGPQGTLYGAGSLGGTVRYVTNKPDSTQFAAAVASDVGSVARGGSENYSFDGMLNVPIVEGLFALRFVGSGERLSGVVTRLSTGRRDVDNEVTTGGRMLAAFTPTESFNLLASVYYQKRRWDDADTYVSSCNPAVNQCFGITGQLSDADHLQTNLPVPLPSNDLLRMYNLTATWDLGVGSLVSTTSYFDRDAQETFDISDVTLSLASVVPTLPYAPNTLGAGRRPETETVLSQEVRFASKFSGPVQAVGGAFYSQRKQDYHEFTSYVDPTGVGPLVPHFVTALNAKYSNKALFGELTYNMTPKWDATVGLRGFQLTTEASDAVLVDDPGFYTLRRCPNGNYSLPPPGVPGLPTCNQPLLPLPLTSSPSERRFNGITYKGSVAYHATDDVLFYATVANGFREGGVNGQRTSNFVPLTYDPDKAINYEMGWKARLLDRQLTLNGAVFRLDWSNTQVQVIPPYGVFGAIYNSGRQRFTGLELETTLRPQAVRGLELTYGMTALDAKLRDRTPSYAAPDGTLMSGPYDGQPGDRPVLVSNLIGNASIQYAFASARWNPYVRMDYSYTGGYRTAYNPNDPLYREVGGYSLISARVGIELAGWNTSLYVNNAANKLGPVSIYARPSVTGGVPYADTDVPLRPRTVGINVRKEFK